ncbi:MAG: adenylyl-sulfate kinase [Candidatus Lindowbacteria bacterium RIFCSPLOWO2_12_FULL_62_27]|nr:MAG: adenylyl-sulfate kinase [Candidatus Lindowbacteria bacterium RIFCSPLOWO2_12_FULL_62_27]OGH63654.1 MAG: adenylyl-sulfate kinase [Candidatus Lindowbacteria bacterium RIFCSPLOWO2_02_FULL_62_12]
MGTEVRATNITWHGGEVTSEMRQDRMRQRGATVWLTGLSASGKSTIARDLERKLHEGGRISYVLDGDNIRHGLNKDLGFSPKDREENIRRIGEVAALFTDANLIVITAFISPYRQDRDNVRKLMKEGQFIEVHVDCDVDTCEKRDPKGLYQKAKAGQIPEFTGISAPYEAPLKPEIVIPSARMSVDEAAGLLMTYLRKNRFLL